MSTSQVLAILFDNNPENIFCAGQLVTGHVQVRNSERINIRGIRLEVTAKADTSWFEGQSTSYIGKEEYLNLEINLIGSRSDASVMYLEPAVYNYPFSFILPPECPQSFEEKFTAHIRYKAKAVIDRPMKIDDKAEVTFTVFRPLDLNLEPSHLREPQGIHSELPVSDCFCITGIAEINASVNRGCFVPGETIFVSGEIANRTNTSVKYSTISLIQKTEYYATKMDGTVYHSAYKLTTLAKCERPSIPRGHTDSWSNISIVVPHALSSRLDGCNIINIIHYIEISATLLTRCSKSTASSEIVIGDIPLRDDVQTSVITSQPSGFPVPYNMCVGSMPPKSMPTLDFDKAGVKSSNHDNKEKLESKKMMFSYRILT